VGQHRRTHRAWTPLARALAAAGDHWTLMIVFTLAPGRMRLAHLQRRLPGVSTGVLERHIQQMDGLGLVSRERFKEMPPRVELELTDAGRELIPIAQALARWGMRHLWSPPHDREHVDLDALLHLLPTLLDGQADLPDGSIKAIVADTEPPICRVYKIERGRLRMADADAGASSPAAGDSTGDAAAGSVSVRGDCDAWIAALGPVGDTTRLGIAGDEQLARRILEALPRGPQPAPSLSQ
jgi:DNA-binding HxlR family transcriptional regulator